MFERFLPYLEHCQFALSINSYKKNNLKSVKNTAFLSKLTTLATMAPEVARIKEIPNIELGEGPHWDIQTQSLYFVDIFGKAVHKYIPASGKHYKAAVGTYPTVQNTVSNKFSCLKANRYR